MKKFKLVILTFILAFSFSINSNSKTVPASFADLAEKLIFNEALAQHSV